MELYNEEAAASFNSNLDLQLHGGEYSIDHLDLDSISEMVEMLQQAPPAPAAYDSDDPRFAPESVNLSSSSHHHLCSLAPSTVGPGDLLGTLQESEAAAAAALKHGFHNYRRKLSCGGRGGNFSSSGESSSERAVSQGSSSTTQADHSSKRKLEDYYQHSSTSDHLLPPTSARGGGGGLRKKPKLTEKDESFSSNNVDFRLVQMKEMIYRAAAMRPLDQLDAAIKTSAAAESSTTKRKNVRISSEPQTVAARQRRERISDRLRILQRLVPGGSKMDTASMLDEAANYLGFLKSQLTAFETLAAAAAACTNSDPPFQHDQYFNHHSFPAPARESKP